MTRAPACRSLGQQCRSLQLTLRVAELDEDDAGFRDQIATWLLGHRERIDFGRLRISGRRVLVNATVHVPCRFLQEGPEQGQARCGAHGFSGTAPGVRRPYRTLLVSGEQTRLVQNGRLEAHRLAERPKPHRSLPTIDANPCAGAPCRTADNVQGAACCRDLILDVVLPAYEMHTEALLESRRAPYLCKVNRVSEDLVECEVISACGYLAGDGVNCSLHDRTRSDGSSAKPSVCSEWPDLDDGDTGHPGCRLVVIP